jgi:dTDP-4-amino-4,6-dideoxygalactose transaminase
MQAIPPQAESSWKDFSITVDAGRLGISRDEVRARLAQRGIDTRAYYSPPCHRMQAFAAHHEGRAGLPLTDRLAAESLSLPLGGHVDAGVARDVARDILRSLP